MSRRLFVSMDRDASHVYWQYADTGQLEGPVQTGGIDDLAQDVTAVPVVVLVPAEDVFLTQVPLPGKNRQRLLNAVPYAVEDQLVDDIEQLHFSLGEQDPQGQYWVAAVNKTQMRQWVDTLEGAGLKLEAMVPDALCLRANDEQGSVVLEGDRALTRVSNNAFACELHNLPLLLKNALRGLPDEHSPRVALYDCSHVDVQQFIQQELGDIEIAQRPCEQGLLGIAAAQWRARDAVNLLHGPYSRREKLGKHLRPWLAPAVVFGLWVLLVLGLQIYQYVQFDQKSQHLHSQMVQLYKRAFPAAEKVPPAGYVRQQMEQRIERLQRERGESETSFQAMLAGTAPVFSRMNGVSLSAIRYYDGQLDVELNLQQAGKLQALTEALSQTTGWDVEVQSAATRDELTEVRLQIKGSGG